MLKKKKVLLVAINLMITFILIGCSDPKSESIKEEKAKPKVEDSLTKYLDSLKNFDEDTITEYSSNKPRDLDLDGDKKEKDIAKLVLEKIEYSIESTSIDGDKATAKVKTKAVDFEKIIPQFVKKSVSAAFKNLKDGNVGSKEQSEELYFQIFKDIVSSKDCDMKEKLVSVYLSLKEDKWVVDNSEDIVKTMFNVRIIDEINKK